ncbi:serine/threonine-protein kinase [Catellatospora chokoriensis]|uniref:Protein kinase domain-containing protein n=1 Tax=Catellatospora chokoriensis TaxID=310353 RepID=A0A8J3NTA8_9ACTN|nr:serine/threonine-protein kinase [Catellatospora chokoriensis]GIF91511.1 hypothetical protein Cch02nite_49550 [Catellatospora chokoriensis]
MEELTPDDPRWIGQKRYELLARLGNGGMGRVYLGKSPLAERAAVKVILPHLVSDADVRKRFEAEVQNLKLAQGIRVAQYRGSEINEKQPWLAVQYVPGRTLRQHVEDRGPLPARTAAALGAMLAEGLTTIHDAGLLHRDLKPANIMLGEDGPCIIDLGLAVLQERDSHLTQTGFAVGTAAYMAPEQAMGEKELTAAVDVYALGATLLYAATKHNPYPSSNPVLLAKRITDPDDHPDLAGLPKELHTIVGAMLAFDEQARPTVQEVLTDLAGIATSGGVDFEVVRHELAQSTYVAPPAVPHPPQDIDDPVVDQDWSLGPTELISQPPQPPVDPTAFDPSPPDTEPAETPQADLTWLVERLRKQYARRATL